MPNFLRSFHLLRKALFFAVCLFAQAVIAGGSACSVEISKVASVDIKGDVITIVGEAITKQRVESDTDHGKDSVYGRPAQWLVGVSFEGVFEVRPYPQAQFKKLWEENLEKAKLIKNGDRVSLVFQGEEITIRDFKVAKVSGPGVILKTP